ncbi:MAG: sulfite exporter TauE/SafE family protein [Planctomycetes bacterium]|nr:sulfite exporter TauE/SafE family protein [Planctomycetota bacterium]
MLELDTLGWLVAIGCAVSIGCNKTSGLGVTILFVPLVAQIMPARESVGFILPMLCISDVIALSYWWKEVKWRMVGRILPWALVGVLPGFYCLRRIDDKMLMPVIGVIILVMIGVTTWQNSRYNRSLHIPTAWWFAAVMGMMTGLTSTLANSAGPIMVIYLLAMRLEKGAFVSTHLGCFWILNLSKVPLYLSLGVITRESFVTDLVLVPGIIVGAVLGVILVHRINQKAFNAVVSLLAVAAVVYLCVKGIM